MKNPSVSTLQCISPYVSLLKPSKTHINAGWLRIKSLSMYLLNWTWIKLKTLFNHRWILLALNFGRWNPNFSRSCSKNKFPATKYIYNIYIYVCVCTYVCILYIYIYDIYIYILYISLSLSLHISLVVIFQKNKFVIPMIYSKYTKKMVAPPKPNASKKRGSTTLEPPATLSQLRPPMLRKQQNYTPSNTERDSKSEKNYGELRGKKTIFSQESGGKTQVSSNSSAFSSCSSSSVRSTRRPAASRWRAALGVSPWQRQRRTWRP